MRPSIETPKMENWGLESIGLAKPAKIFKLTGTGTGMGNPDRAGRVIWLFWNSIERFIWSNPGLLACYPVLLLTLAVAGNMSRLFLTQKTATTAITIVSIRSTWVFRTALTDHHTLWWKSTHLPSPRCQVALLTYLLHFTRRMWWCMSTIRMTPVVDLLQGCH